MKKYFGIGLLAVLMATVWAAPAAAQMVSNAPEAAGGLGADEGAAGTVLKGLNATSNHFAVRYQCTDPTGTSTSISVAIADVGIEGDLWGATVSKGTKAALFRTTANQAAGPGGAAPFAPGVFSPTVAINTAVKKVDVAAGLRSSIPDCSLPWPFCVPGPYTGLPAGATLRIITNGGGPVCTRKQVIGGTAGL